MIRPFTALCMLASLGSVFYMFQMKHRSEVQDAAIKTTIAETLAARERVAMLRAEYARKSDEGRLLELSDRFLKLKPTQPTQFVQLADLGARLPAPRLDANDVLPEEAEPNADIQLPAEPPVAAAMPVQTGSAPVLAAARAVPKPVITAAPVKSDSDVAETAPSRPAAPQARVATAQPVLQPAAPSKPAAPVATVSTPKPQTVARPPVGAPILQAAASPTRVTSAPQGSLLGGFSGGLAAPVPLGAAGANGSSGR